MEKRITGYFIALIALTMMLSLPNKVFAANETVDMVDMHEMEGQKWEKVESITDSYGNSYNGNILKLDSSEDGYISYDLNGNYKSFKGNLVCSVETGSEALLNVGFFADGKLIYSASDITRQQDAREINIDLTGVGTLEIKTSNTGEYPYGWLFFVNSVFEKADSTESYSKWAKLSDMVVIDAGSDYEYRKGLAKDVMGDLHNGAIQLDASNETYVLYNLNGEFTNLRGKLIAFPETRSDVSMTVHIFADDKEVFSKSAITKQEAGTDMEIDVTGVKVLKMTTSNEGEYPYGRIFIVDDILS